MTLTDTQARQAKWSGKTKAGDKLSDGEGLYLHVMPSGSRLWRMAYRFAGKQRTLAIGVYPAVSLAQARKARDDARELLAQGIDPSDHKRTRKAAGSACARGTLEAMGRAWLALKADGWSDTHRERETRNLQTDLFPHLGRRPIGSIEPPELLAVIRKIEARGVRSVARRVLTTARGVWQYAIGEGYATRDITQDIAKNLKATHKRNFPAITDPVAFGALLRASDGHKGGPVVCTALYTCPYLFQRPGNLRAMRWRDLDLDGALWTIPSADMKRTKEGKAHGDPHPVPLPRQVVQALRELHPLTGHREYVFPGARDPLKPMSEAAMSAALASIGYKGRQTWHGYRASGRTLIRELLGYDPDVIEAQLAHTGHIKHGGAYDRAKFIATRTQMIQEWADCLDRLRRGAEVIPFARGA